jgi:hypothetical protein
MSGPLYWRLDDVVASLAILSLVGVGFETPGPTYVPSAPTLRELRYMISFSKLLKVWHPAWAHAHGARTVNPPLEAGANENI